MGSQRNSSLKFKGLRFLIMLNKKFFLSFVLAIAALCLWALPSQAGLIGNVGLEKFTGILTEVSNISVNVVNYDHQKVVTAFVPAEIGYKNKLQQSFRAGDKVQIKVYRDKQSGRYILSSIKKLSDGNRLK